MKAPDAPRLPLRLAMQLQALISNDRDHHDVFPGGRAGKELPAKPKRPKRTK
jgi:hypothetical protein